MRKKEQTSWSAVLISILLHTLLFGGLIAFSFFEIKETQTGGEEKGNAIEAVMVNTEVVHQAVIAKHQAALKAKQERESAQRKAEEAKVKAELEAQRKVAEAKVKAELEAQRKAAEAKVKAELEAQRKAEEQKAKAALELKRKAEEAKLKAELEAKRQAEELKLQKEQQLKQKIEEEKRQKEEAEKQQIALEKKIKEQEEAKRKAIEKRKAEKRRRQREAQEAKRKAEEQAQLDAVRDFELGDLSSELSGSNISSQANSISKKGNSDTLGDTYGNAIKSELKRRFIRDPSFENKVCNVEVEQDREGNIINYSKVSGAEDICAMALRAVALTKKLPVAPTDRIYKKYRKFSVDFKLK